MTFFQTRSGDFVGTPPQVIKIRGGGARDRQSIRFRTLCNPEFKFYYDLFYPANPGCRRKKRVAENIWELLTARALAYWFMDDGSYTSNKNRTSMFSTHSFHPNPVRVSFSAYPYSDQERLVQALRYNFGISATIQKQYSYYRLYIR